MYSSWESRNRPAAAHSVLHLVNGNHPDGLEMGRCRSDLKSNYRKVTIVALQLALTLLHKIRLKQLTHQRNE